MLQRSYVLEGLTEPAQIERAARVLSEPSTIDGTSWTVSELR